MPPKTPGEEFAKIAKNSRSEGAQKLQKRSDSSMSEIPKKNRSVIVNVRLTDDERDYLEYRQKFIGARSLSAYIRYAAISTKLNMEKAAETRHRRSDYVKQQPVRILGGMPQAEHRISVSS